jgi:hypothetical protein
LIMQATQRVVAEVLLHECIAIGSFATTAAVRVSEYAGPPRPNQILMWSLDHMDLWWVVPAAVDSAVLYSLTINSIALEPKLTLFKQLPPPPPPPPPSPAEATVQVNDVFSNVMIRGPAPPRRLRPPLENDPQLHVEFDASDGFNDIDRTTRVVSSDPHQCIFVKGGDVMQFFSSSVWEHGDSVSLCIAYI